LAIEFNIAQKQLPLMTPQSFLAGLMLRLSSKLLSCNDENSARVNSRFKLFSDTINSRVKNS